MAVQSMVERLAWKGACFERQSAIFGLLHKPKWASNHRRLPLFFSDHPPTLWRRNVSVKGRWLRAVEKGRMCEEDECFQEVDRPLSTIADAFEELASSLRPGSKLLRLDEFCAACSLVSVLFNCLGLAFKFAEMEYDHKVI